MKLSLLFTLCLYIFTNGLFAQTSDTYDIATFTPPTGWRKQTKQGAVLFATADEKKNTFALLTIYTSGASSGDAKRDFETDWQEFIAGQLHVAEKPEIQTAKTDGGWDSVTGAAQFQSDLGPTIVVLNTFSGFGKSFSMAAVFNDQGYLPAIESFVSSVSLAKPTAPKSPSSSDTGTSVVGTWGASGSNQSSYAVSNGIAGYIKKQYTFNTNGTYEFFVKTFQYSMTNLLFTKETGTYQLSGNSLTLTPQKGFIQAWTKATVVDNTGRRSQTDKWGQLVSTQPTKLEKVTYQITKHYFSGIDQWQLVMQASKPTERDGPFTTNADFPNSWLYGPPCATCFIEPPR